MSALTFLVGAGSSGMLLCFALNNEQHPKTSHGVVIAFTNMMIMIIGGTVQPIIGYLLDSQSAKQAAAGFTLAQYQHALLIVPILIVVSLLLVFFIRAERKKA